MNNPFLVLVGISLVIVVFFSFNTPVNPDWEEDYRKALDDEGVSSVDYLSPDRIIDYDDKDLMVLINNIREESTSADDALRKAIKHTSRELDYDWTTNCFDSTSSSEIFNTNSGHCVHMTKLDLALVRGLGLAARPVGGCLLPQNVCAPLFSLVDEGPKTPPTIDKSSKSRKGYLHQWLQVWLPDKGWVNVEATTGTVYEEDCGLYVVSDFTLNCEEPDDNFADECYEK